MGVYIKDVNGKELEFMKIASDYDISPKLIMYTKIDDDEYRTYSDEYEKMLSDVPKMKRRFYIEAIKDKIRQLHRLGIFHGDIHEENIVIRDDDVRIIDYGLSQKIEDIRQDYLDHSMYLISSDKGEIYPKNVEELLEFESLEVDFISK